MNCKIAALVVFLMTFTLITPANATPTADETTADEAQFLQTAEVGTMLRLAGPDRLSTAVAIADQLYNPEEQRAFGDILVIASSENFPDALTAGSLAVRLSAPLLLNPKDRVSDVTREAANRYTSNADRGKRTVVLVGGEAALSAIVADEFAAEGWAIKRVQGPNRFATAVDAAEFTGSTNSAFIADGGEFQDAVVASNVAGLNGAVLLTAGGSMPPETAAYLSSSGVGATTIGGPAGAAAPQYENVSGPGSAGTSIAVAQRFFGDYRGFAVARVDNFADALAGSQLSGRVRYPLLLVNQDSTPDDVVNEISRTPRDLGYIYGGTSAVGDAIHGQIGRVGGRISCSFAARCQLTFSRVATRAVCDQVCGEGTTTAGGAALAATRGCAFVAGPVAGAVCGAVAGIVGAGIFNDIRRASENGNCFALRYYPIIADPRAIPNPTVIVEGAECDRVSQ